MAELNERLLCALADGCGILSLMLDFKRLPEVISGTVEGSMQEDMTAISAELLDSISLSADDTEETLHLVNEALAQFNLVQAQAKENMSSETWNIRREHTRLFDDPDKPALPYYEGAFINRRYQREGKDAPDQDILFINRAANDADRQYKRAGLKRDPSQNIPGDCMITEMAFLQYMATKTAADLSFDAMLREFIRLHMRPWAQDFFSELTKESSNPYFQGVGAWGSFLIRTMSAIFPTEF